MWGMLGLKCPLDVNGLCRPGWSGWSSQNYGSVRGSGYKVILVNDSYVGWCRRHLVHKLADGRKRRRLGANVVKWIDGES
jgi:hypothetical protein